MRGVLEGLVDFAVHHDLEALVLGDDDVAVVDALVDPLFEGLADDRGSDIADPRLGEVAPVSVVRIVLLHLRELTKVDPDLGEGEALVCGHDVGTEVFLQDV